MTAPVSTSTDLAALKDMHPAAREVEVTRYLMDARDRLTLAVNLSGPEAVAAMKAEIATAAEATKQLGLSKEIQSDAQEMVRRAEYALGKAIRAGQERGEINSLDSPGNRPRTDYVRAGNVIHVGDVPERNTSSPSDFVPNASERDAIYRMVDNATATEFEAALEDAKAEGNVSRANVVRKIKGVKGDGLTPVEKIATIREMAGRGHTSDQIAREISATEDYVRRRARECNIEIPGDRVMRGTRRLDHTKFVNETVVQLEALASGLDVLDLTQVDPDQIDYWATSLSDSLKKLSGLARRIKEMAQ